MGLEGTLPRRARRREHGARRDGDAARDLPRVRARGLVGWLARRTVLRGARVRHHARADGCLRDLGRDADRAQRPLWTGSGGDRPLCHGALSSRQDGGEHGARSYHRRAGGGGIDDDTPRDRGHPGPVGLRGAPPLPSQEIRRACIGCVDRPVLRRPRDRVVGFNLRFGLGRRSMGPEPQEPRGSRALFPQGRRVHDRRRIDDDRVHPGPGRRTVRMADAA